MEVQPAEQEVRAVERSPRDECPVGAVPEATQHEGHQHDGDPGRPNRPIPSERREEISRGGVIVARLYLPCRWFMKVKQEHKDWRWLSYL